MSKGFGAASARSGFALGFSAGVIVSAAFFLLRDAPEAPRTERLDPAVALSAMSAPATATGPGDAGSMETATLALKVRLATQGGTDEQWELLAKSYDFMGRSAEAQQARKHRTSPGGDLRDAVAASARLLPGAGAGPVPATTAGNNTPPEAKRLLAGAEQYRRKRDFRQACDAYAAVVALGAMTADTWADYADAQASLAGRLSGAPEKAIEKALAIDPQHPKALWLRASLAHEQHRYEDALATWRRLLALVPPGSSDAQIVEANIAEAKRLASG
jgi:cytochrome c-type biogenesis protein CcmH/NrfG